MIIVIDIIFVVGLLVIRSYFSQWLVKEKIEGIPLEKTFLANSIWIIIAIITNGILYYIYDNYHTLFSPLAPFLSLFSLVIEFMTGLFVIYLGLKLGFWDTIIHSTVILVTHRFLLRACFMLIIFISNENFYGEGIYIFIFV